MLANPFANQFKTAMSIRRGEKREVEYLVQVCDPCGDSSYSIDGITLADFCMPEFYDSKVAGKTQFNFTKTIKKPLQILKGGYLIKLARPRKTTIGGRRSGGETSR